MLHIAFGTGMTQSAVNAERAAAQLRERYPERKLLVVDSLCSSSGYGMLVDYAADMRDEGCSIEQTQQWLLKTARTSTISFIPRSLRITAAADACPAPPP